MPGSQKASYTLELDEQLGKLIKAHRHCWYDCYKTEQGLIFRDNEANELKLYLPNYKGFHIFDSKVNRVPDTTYLIEVHIVDLRL